jgi:hypothetical protein
MLPANEQPIEAVRFLKGSLHRLFVTVGADRFLRFWDHSGNYIAEVATGKGLDTVIQSSTAIATHCCRLSSAKCKMNQSQCTPKKRKTLAHNIMYIACFAGRHVKCTTCFLYEKALLITTL